MISENLLNIKVDFLTFGDIRDTILSYISERKRIIINYVNASSIVLANNNNALKGSFDISDLTFPDGTGVFLAAKLLSKNKNIKRFNLSDHEFELLKVFNDHSLKIYLLGSTDDILKKAKTRIISRFNKINIVGMGNGFGEHENEKIIERISSSEADILLLGLGTPAQELWISDHQNKLGNILVISVGDLFSLFAGVKKRGPVIFQQLGFEWFFRILGNPKIYFIRYFFSIPRFIFLVLREKIRTSVA